MWATKNGPACLRCRVILTYYIVIMLAGSCSSSGSLVGHRLTHRDKGETKYKGKIFVLLFMTSNSGQKFPFIIEFKLPKFERDHQIFFRCRKPFKY